MTEFDPTLYGASIADDYDDLYSDSLDTDAAVQRLAELAAGGPVLEFGIGTGRLALPLVRRGLEVPGVEASAEMIAKLHEKPEGDRIPIVIGDFSEAYAGSDFALVVLAYNTIFALPDQQAQVRCFANAARHLRPGGRFVIEAWVPDVGAFRHNLAVQPRILRSDLVSIEVAELDPVRQMMRTMQSVMLNGSVRLHPANHRYAWPSELDLMAQLASLRFIERRESWAGAPFTAESRNHVSVYER